MAIYFSDRAEMLVLASDQQTALRIAEITRLLQETPPDLRERFVHAANSPTLQVTLAPESLLAQPTDDDWRSALLERYLSRLVPADSAHVVVQWLEVPDAGQHLDMASPMSWVRGHLAQIMTGTPLEHAVKASVRLNDGQWVNFATTFPESEHFWSNQAVLSTALMTIAVALFSLWVVRRMTRPLRAFASASERLGRDVNAPPVEEAGPLEVRQAIRAFNKMQERLRRLIENRTRMLAAISHDLRTPITLLGLRAEYIEDEEEKRKTLATLVEMESMIASTLAFAKDDAFQEDPRIVDLPSLVASICDNMTDAGRQVEFEETAPLKYSCRPFAIRRALTNVIDNAIKYGGNAKVKVSSSQGAVEIVVDDDGPGIPDSELDEVFAPFYRLERSRSRETGGAGLGLSIARTIAHAHGGEIVLSNRPEGGLRATIQLPL
jgi:signal transduction histidine kinase